jgi:flagellar L-ring protein precursor FlgH
MRPTFIIFSLAAVLAGCATTPSSIVMQPTAAASPQPAPAAAPANGAIFQSASYRPMFEDRRARLVGDTLTIAINERTSAEKKAGSSASKTGSVEAAAPSLFGLGASATKILGASAQSSAKFEEKGGDSSSNAFSGQLTVTVVQVLPNGNLVVSGEKQVGLDKGVEFIRFSGVVNPTTIGANNIVSSTQVADARAEYRTNRHVDSAEMMSMLTRFFLSVLPL